MTATTLKRGGLIATETAALALTWIQFAGATSCNSKGQVSSATAGANCAVAKGIPQTISVTTLIQDVSNVLIFLVGAISVIMLIVGGFRYVVSAGNPSAVKGAKDTIVFSIVGIVVAVAAYAVVSFIFAQLGVKS